MTAIADVVTRKRNAAATRELLLKAATARFVRDGYETVSLREIASDAGVDVSLVSRYFGGKEELFSAVLSACPAPDEVFTGQKSTWGARIAAMLIHDPIHDGKLDVIQIILRSASSPTANRVIRKNGEERFFGPFRDWLGEPNAEHRIHLAGALMKGVAFGRLVEDDLGMDDTTRTQFENSLAKLLQAAIEG
jgi:AcrR family transcriptional regulator